MKFYITNYTRDCCVRFNLVVCVFFLNYCQLVCVIAYLVYCFAYFLWVSLSRVVSTSETDCSPANTRLRNDLLLGSLSPRPPHKFHSHKLFQLLNGAVPLSRRDYYAE